MRGCVGWKCSRNRKPLESRGLGDVKTLWRDFGTTFYGFPQLVAGRVRRTSIRFLKRGVGKLVQSEATG
jgi:hypothetical protein